MQRWIALAIAVLTGIWAAWKVLRPIINEFRKKKTLDAGCCGCGTKSGGGACMSEKKIDARS